MASDRRVFSHSRLGTLEDCPRRYRFRYVDGLKEAFQSIEAFLGTMVHEVIQWAYVEREQRISPTLDAVVERYHAAWKQRTGPHVRVVQEGREPREYLAEGEEMIRRHHATTFATDRLETLSVEPRIDLAIGDNGFMGFIDRLARDAAGMLHVIDYKTSRSMPRDADAAGLQARGYAVAVLEKHGGLEVGIRYEYLRHGRMVEETFPLARSADVRAAIAARIGAALAAEAVGEFPARPGPLCRWCGFRDSCDASPFYPGEPAGSPGLSRGGPPSAAPSGHAAVPRVGGIGELGACPVCGSALQRRSGSRGDMIACARYPECRHSRKA